MLDVEPRLCGCRLPAGRTAYVGWIDPQVQVGATDTGGGDAQHNVLQAGGQIKSAATVGSQLADCGQPA